MITIQSVRQRLHTLLGVVGLNIETRTRVELKEHYEIEKELANKLRVSSREERGYLYSSLYDEHFRRVQVHLPQRSKPSAAKRIKLLSPQLLFLRHFVKKDTIFLEIGAGDCSVSFAMAPLVRKVYAVEVSAETIKHVTCPPNFELILFDGFKVPVADNSVDIIYSDQVMEHLHPDDALEQLKNIHKLLTTCGMYICITPNRLSGPHDISRNFDTTATGFHLKEYTNTELSVLFQRAGFSAIRAYVGAMGLYARFPLSWLKLLERGLDKLPYQRRKRFANGLLLVNIRLVGLK